MNSLERLQNDGAVRAATKLAVEDWTGLEIEPIHPAQRRQLAIALRLGDRGDAELALEVVRALGESFENNLPNESEKATRALGAVLIGVARLAAKHGLAIGPIGDLGRVFTHRQDVIPLAAQGALAWCVTATEPVGRERWVAALALCIAKGVDDIEMVHDLRVRPLEVFNVVADELLAKAVE